MAKKQESKTSSDPKEDKKAAKKAKKSNLSPFQRASRNMYWFFMTVSFGIVVWLGYEAFNIYMQNQ